MVNKSRSPEAIGRHFSFVFTIFAVMVYALCGRRVFVDAAVAPTKYIGGANGRWNEAGDWDNNVLTSSNVLIERSEASGGAVVAMDQAGTYSVGSIFFGGGNSLVIGSGVDFTVSSISVGTGSGTLPVSITLQPNAIFSTSSVYGSANVLFSVVSASPLSKVTLSGLTVGMGGILLDIDSSVNPLTFYLSIAGPGQLEFRGRGQTNIINFITRGSLAGGHWLFSGLSAHVPLQCSNGVVIDGSVRFTDIELAAAVTGSGAVSLAGARIVSPTSFSGVAVTGPPAGYTNIFDTKLGGLIIDFMGWEGTIEFSGNPSQMITLNGWVTDGATNAVMSAGSNIPSTSIRGQINIGVGSTLSVVTGQPTQEGNPIHVATGNFLEFMGSGDWTGRLQFIGSAQIQPDTSVVAQSTVILRNKLTVVYAGSTSSAISPGFIMFDAGCEIQLTECSIEQRLIQSYTGLFSTR